MRELDQIGILVNVAEAAWDVVDSLPDKIIIEHEGLHDLITALQLAGYDPPAGTLTLIKKKMKEGKP